MRWIPIAGFVLLGVVFIDKALRRGARRNWAWGRSGGRVALSRRSYGIIGLMFFATAFTVARAPEPGLSAVAVMSVCFISVIVSGWLDTRTSRE